MAIRRGFGHKVCADIGGRPWLVLHHHRFAQTFLQFIGNGTGKNIRGSPRCGRNNDFDWFGRENRLRPSGQVVAPNDQAKQNI